MKIFVLSALIGLSSLAGVAQGEESDDRVYSLYYVRPAAYIPVEAIITTEVLGQKIVSPVKGEAYIFGTSITLDRKMKASQIAAAFCNEGETVKGNIAFQAPRWQYPYENWLGLPAGPVPSKIYWSLSRAFRVQESATANGVSFTYDCEDENHNDCTSRVLCSTAEE